MCTFNKNFNTYMKGNFWGNPAFILKGKILSYPSLWNTSNPSNLFHAWQHGARASVTDPWSPCRDGSMSSLWTQWPRATGWGPVHRWWRISLSAIKHTSFTTPQWCRFLKAHLGLVYTNGPWSQTMEDGLFPWSDFLKNQLTKSLELWLRVNQMWTKRNGHAPKNECADFFNICAKRAILKRKEKNSILLSLSTLPPKKIINFYYTVIKIVCHGPLPFFFFFLHQSASFASLTTKPVGPCQ
jgi:hypothetical protein